MSDTTENPIGEVGDTGNSNGPNIHIETKPEEAPAQEPDWKAEARKWEKRAKENSDAAQRLAEIEEANKTEQQKQAERLAELESQVSDYQTREQIAAWKAEVAAETGVPADVLSGSTKEELEAHASKLKPLIDQSPASHQPISGEGQPAALPLNSNGIESALKNALGIK